MDYKEKYEQALERASKLRVQNPFDTVGQMVEHIFPDLQENEDERIRKSIISVLKGEIRYISIEDTNKYVTWLEKQGEKKSDFSNIRIWKYIVDAVLTEKDGIGQYLDNPDTERIAKKLQEKYGNIEKQGECSWKPTEEQFEALDYAYNSYPDTEKGNYYEGVLAGLIADLHKLYEKQDENKPTDKVESKFHEGEWIIHQGTENIYQVVACVDNQYQLKYGDNYTVQKCTDVDRCARLWDITKDAKDGDVLTNGEFIVIFKQIVEPKYRQHIEAYIGLDLGCNIQVTSKSWSLGIDRAIPATKEQRDLLFQKMKDAGYEWNSEKKQLSILNLGC